MNLQSFQGSHKFKLTLIVILGLFGFLFYQPEFHVPVLTALLAALGGYFTGHIVQKKQGDKYGCGKAD